MNDEKIKALARKWSRAGHMSVDEMFEAAIREALELKSEVIEQAHMAGQAEAGIDPSYSNAKNYANEIQSGEYDG